MKYALYVLAGLYAVLSVIAALTQLKTAKKKDAPVLMLSGGFLLAAAVVLQVAFGFWGWLPALIGGAMVSIAAYLNGSRSGKLHISHHIVRAVFTAALIIGFLLL